MKIIQPKRKRHSCTQTWQASPERAFPLLCPVRETDWVPGWSPKLVVSESGLMEPGCLFVVPEAPPEAHIDTTWVVTRHEPSRFTEMYRVLPGVTVSRFSVRLEPGPDDTTHASLTYEHTSLSEAGDRVVEEFTGESFAEFADHFATAINHYLTTGEKIAAAS